MARPLPVTDDFKPLPYWWDAAPRRPAQPPPLPARADVAIIGSGITGLVAALDLARGGRSVVVLDKGDLGGGASTRNAGYVGRTLKHGFGEIMSAQGLQRAIAVYREMQAAFDAVADLVAAEGIDCAFVRCGRFTAAPSEPHYEALAAEMELRRKYLGQDFAMVQRGDLHREVATDLWHGGVVVPDLAALHPGRYHQGLLDRARAAGAALHGATTVQGIGRDGGGMVVFTDRGVMRARDVVAATNGYTDRALPWQRRRVIPFNAFMVATETLAPERIARLLPGGRTVIDDGRNPYFVRPSPDGSRLLFGGATGRATTDPLAVAPALHATLVALLPDLAGVRLSHAWTGRCAGTWDLYPHIGARDGVHHAMGYCFAGVPMGTHFGRKIAARVLGRGDGATAFDQMGFPTMPLYGGNPWFAPLILRWWEWRDAPR